MKQKKEREEARNCSHLSSFSFLFFLHLFFFLAFSVPLVNFYLLDSRQFVPSFLSFFWYYFSLITQFPMTASSNNTTRQDTSRLAYSRQVSGRTHSWNLGNIRFLESTICMSLQALM